MKNRKYQQSSTRYGMKNYGGIQVPRRIDGKHVCRFGCSVKRIEIVLCTFSVLCFYIIFPPPVTLDLEVRAIHKH